MANTPYSKTAGKRNARPPVDPAAEPEPARYSDTQDAPAGLFSSPARVVAIISSFIVLLVIFSAVVFLLGSRSQENSLSAVSVGNVNLANTEEAPRVGALAPYFQLNNVRTGQAVKMTDLRGKPVFLNFWATWCPPCRMEMPEMQKIYGQWNDKVNIIGISMGPRDNEAGVKSFVDLANYSWTFLHDPDYSTATNYYVDSIPVSYFIDKNGVIRATHLGAMTSDQITSYLQQITSQ